MIADTKPIRFKLDKWQEVRDLADELSDELNMTVYLQDAVGYAIKFYHEHKAGTPGVSGTAKGSN